jgi:hypothetical protein
MPGMLCLRLSASAKRVPIGRTKWGYFVLTIDNQPLVLKLEAILALFGKARTMEFAEGKWTPFVLFQVEDEPNSVTVVQRIDFTGLDKSEIERALEELPPDVRDFPGFVRDAIEKIEKARSGHL